MAKKKRDAASGFPGGDSRALHPDAPPIESNTQDEPSAKRQRRRARKRARGCHQASEEEQPEDVTLPATSDIITAKQSPTQMSGKLSVDGSQPPKPKPTSKIRDKEGGASTKLATKGPDMHAKEPRLGETGANTTDQGTQTIKTRHKRIVSKDAATQTEVQEPEWRPGSRKRKRGEHSSSSSSDSDESSSTTGYSGNDGDDKTSWCGDWDDEWDDWEREYDSEDPWFDAFDMDDFGLYGCPCRTFDEDAHLDRWL